MGSIERTVAAQLERPESEYADSDLVGLLLAEVRRRDRSARGTTGLFRYTRNGSCKSERTCYLCNCVASWATKWPRTDRSWKIENDDRATHVARVREMARAVRVVVVVG